jgi:hypothetical protein
MATSCALVKLARASQCEGPPESSSGARDSAIVRMTNVLESFSVCVGSSSGESKKGVTQAIEDALGTLSSRRFRLKLVDLVHGR